MYTKNYNEVIDFIENLNAKSFLLAIDAFPIEKMLIQPLERNIEGKNIRFLSLRDIKISKSERNQGIMTFLLDKMIKSGISIMVDDIINDNLFNYLLKNRFKSIEYIKNGSKMRSAYLIQ